LALVNSGLSLTFSSSPTQDDKSLLVSAAGAVRQRIFHKQSYNESEFLLGFCLREVSVPCYLIYSIGALQELISKNQPLSTGCGALNNLLLVKWLPYNI